MGWFNSKWFWHVFDVNFSCVRGRASRSEFWSFYMVCVLTSIILILIDKVLIGSAQPYITFLFFISIMIPTVCLQIRRLHDLNKSGWFVLFLFIPVIGTLALIAIGVIKGDQTENRFGAMPPSIPKA